MTYLVNLVLNRFAYLNFSNPLVFTDFVIALLIVIGFLAYLHRFPLFRVILGTIFLLALSILFFAGGFIFTALVFGFASVLILFGLPLIFAPEIRHYLEKLGRFYQFKMPSFSEKRRRQIFSKNLSEAVFDLAKRKVGAIIVVERRTHLGHLTESGIIVGANFSSKLLETIFYPNTPLHDGAVVIKDGKILAAKCIIPVSAQVKLDPPFGLRHRAGLSITLETDAVSIIVSEQRGEVSLAENGRLETDLSAPALIEKLEFFLSGY